MTTTTAPAPRTDLIGGFEPAYVAWCEAKGLRPESVGAAARFCAWLRR